MEGTVTCFDAETKQIIDVQHISKRLMILFIFLFESVLF